MKMSEAANLVFQGIFLVKHKSFHGSVADSYHKNLIYFPEVFIVLFSFTSN